MVNKKRRQFFIISVIMFLVSSFILLVNNLTELFKNYGFSISLNIISWMGIIFSIFWFVVLVSYEKFN